MLKQCTDLLHKIITLALNAVMTNR